MSLLFSGIKGFLNYLHKSGVLSHVFGGGTKPVGATGFIFVVFTSFLAPWWRFKRSSPVVPMSLLFSGIKGFFNWVLTSLLLSAVVGGGTRPVGDYGLILSFF